MRNLVVQSNQEGCENNGSFAPQREILLEYNMFLLRSGHYPKRIQSTCRIQNIMI